MQAWGVVRVLTFLSTSNTDFRLFPTSHTFHIRGPQGELHHRTAQKGKGAREEEEEEKGPAQDYKLAHEGLCE